MSFYNLFGPVDSTAEAAAFIKTFRLCLCSVVSRSFASARAGAHGSQPRLGESGFCAKGRRLVDLYFYRLGL